MADWVELHGDRAFGDDAAIVAGFATFRGRSVAVIGHQKGRGTKERIRRNFGQPRPEGYRKALRVMRLAERFGLPVLTFIDTPGAYPGLDAEERGQAEAIAAQPDRDGRRCRCRSSSTITGEGWSGGALALGVGDRVLMLEYAVYSVISPEGCAAILWKDQERKADAAEALRITAPDLLRTRRRSTRSSPSRAGGAQADHEETFRRGRPPRRHAAQARAPRRRRAGQGASHDRYRAIGVVRGEVAATAVATTAGFAAAGARRSRRCLIAAGRVVVSRAAARAARRARRRRGASLPRAVGSPSSTIRSCSTAWRRRWRGCSRRAGAASASPSSATTTSTASPPPRCWSRCSRALRHRHRADPAATALLEGYGFQAAPRRARAQSAGCSLIVTVDCGSTARAAVERAREAGVDVIVTDHHLPSQHAPAGDRADQSAPARLPRIRSAISPAPGSRSSWRRRSRSAAIVPARARCSAAHRLPRHHRRRGAAARREPHHRRARPEGAAPDAAPRGCGR